MGALTKDWDRPRCGGGRGRTATGLSEACDRQVILAKVKAMLRKGPTGVLRLAKNGARLAAARWEKPARAGWWEDALSDAGFCDVEVETLAHEGIASARKPL